MSGQVTVRLDPMEKATRQQTLRTDQTASWGTSAPEAGPAGLGSSSGPCGEQNGGLQCNMGGLRAATEGQIAWPHEPRMGDGSTLGLNTEQRTEALTSVVFFFLNNTFEQF